jgi:hypothetical protein
MSERTLYFFFVLPAEKEAPALQKAIGRLTKEVISLEFTRANHEPRDAQQAATGFLFHYWFRSEPEYDVAVATDFSLRQALVRVSVNFFLQDETVEAVLSFLRRFCEEFQPAYGYGPAGATDYPTPTLIEMVDSGCIEAVHNFNFLGEEIVRQYGLEQLRTMPGWQIEILFSHALLVVLTLNPLSGSGNRYARRRAEAERILRVNQGGCR